VALLLVFVGIAGRIGALFRTRRKSAHSGDRPPSSSAPLSAPAGRGMVPWILVALGFCMTLLPWTVRNAVVLSAVNETRPRHLEALPTFVPITLYGPLNLAWQTTPRQTAAFQETSSDPPMGRPISIRPTLCTWSTCFMATG